MTFGTGWPSYSVTSTFDGLMSRWMMPFWWACCTAWQTGTNSSSRSRGVSCCSSQYSVIGTPLTSSITKYGRPASVVPASSTLAMFGWSISASACRSASKRAITCRVSIPGLMTFSATVPLDRLGLLGHVDDAHAALADLLEQLVGADDACRAFGDGLIDASAWRAAGGDRPETRRPPRGREAVPRLRLAVRGRPGRLRRDSCARSSAGFRSTASQKMP